MCATYGLDPNLVYDLPPLNEREHHNVLEQWIAHHGGTARITGNKARNLNPLITTDQDGNRTLQLAWWWLHIHNEPAKFSAFNARDDKLLRSPAWKTPFRNHRALAPATWYVEKGTVFALPDRSTFGIAAITTNSYHGGVDTLTYALVTRNAVAQAATVHPRMPLILPAEMHDDWLNPRITGDAALLAEALAASDEISESMEIIHG